MRYTRLLALSSFLVFIVCSFSQNQINPGNQIRWPLPSCANAQGIYAPAQNLCLRFDQIPPGNMTWPSNCTPGMVYSPGQNTCVQQGGTANNPALPVNSLQKNGGTNFAPASTADIGAAISDTNQNYILANTVPTLGWPLPSPLSLSNEVLLGTNAGQALGNWTPITTTATAGSGATTLTVASSAGMNIYNRVSGAGIASGTYITTAPATGATTITINNATTAALSSTPITVIPGATGGLIAIGNGACQSCQSNNGSVVIGVGALQNDTGYGTGGEDQNGVFIGPSAGSGETGYPSCAFNNPASGGSGNFEPVLIGNKVGGTGCGWAGTQMIGNHIYQIGGAVGSTLMGNEIGPTPGVWVIPNGVVGIGHALFNTGLRGGTPPAAGNYTVSNTTCVGNGNCADAFSSFNTVIGTALFNGPLSGTVITGTHNNVMGDSTVNNLTSGSYNDVIGGSASSGNPTAVALTTANFDVIIGHAAAQALTTASNSTIIGYGAAIATTTNTIDAIGNGSCRLATGSNNTCVGNNSGNNITSGTNNIVVGNNNASGTGPYGVGSYNTEIGTLVGAGADTSSYNSFYGANAGRRATASTAGTNEAFGYGEFQTSSGTTGTEQYDVFMGDSSSCVGCTNLISLGHAANFAPSLTHAVQLDTGTNNASHTMQWENVNFLDDSGNASFKTVGVQSVPTIASAATIAPTSSLIKVSGTTAITTITPPVVAQNGAAFRGCIKIIPTGAFTTATGGNIALASTAVVNRVMDECYDGTQWYPSY